MNAQKHLSFRKTLLLVGAAHLGVACLPLAWLTWGHPPTIADGGKAQRAASGIQWLDPSLTVPAPSVEPPLPVVAEVSALAPVPPPVNPVPMRRPGRADPPHLPRTLAKQKFQPPQRLNFQPAADSVRTAAVTERPTAETSFTHVGTPPTSGQTGLVAAAEEDALRAYHERIQRVMESHWKQPPHAPTDPVAVAKVAVTILRNGRVDSVKLAASSGSPAMDRTALAAAHAVPQIDPLPTAVRGDSYQLLIRFVLH